MRFFFIVLIASMVAACSSTKVSFNFDPEIDFSKYTSYKFDNSVDSLPANQFSKDRIIKAIDTEMAKKGLTKSDNPDLIITLLGTTEQKIETFEHTTGSTYGPAAYGISRGMANTNVSYDEYQAGTLIIGLIDDSTKKMIWQGSGSKKIDENANSKVKETGINYVVQQILRNYPPENK